jgi:hypothetical protein
MQHPFPGACLPLNREARKKATIRFPSTAHAFASAVFFSWHADELTFAKRARSPGARRDPVH